QQQECPSRQQVQAGGQPSQQVKPEGGGADEQRPAISRTRPFVLIGQPGQGQKEDVIVLHHVLRVVKVSCAEQQSEHSGDRLLGGESQPAQESETDQSCQDVDQDVRAVADHDVTHGRVSLTI